MFLYSHNDILIQRVYTFVAARGGARGRGRGGGGGGGGGRGGGCGGNMFQRRQ